MDLHQPVDAPADRPADRPAETVRRYAAALDARDWEALAACLAPGFVARFVHTGETFDAAAYVAFNRDYPGAWRYLLDDLVAAGDRVAGRAVVTDGRERFHVAVFGTVVEGLLTALVEVWTEAERPPPRGDRHE